MVRPVGGGGTRERILEIALELFSSQGYEGTSIRDISDRMGITKAAVYYHFPSKESLLADVLSPAMTRVRQVLADAETVTTAEQRRRLATGIVDVVGDAGPQVVVLLSDPAVSAHLKNVMGNGLLPQQVGEALVGRLPDDPADASRARIRAACAIGCLPAGIEAWRRDNPGRVTLDDDAKAVLVEIVLAVVESSAPR